MVYAYYRDYKSIKVEIRLKIEECVMGLYVGIIVESQAHKTWLFLLFGLQRLCN